MLALTENGNLLYATAEGSRVNLQDGTVIMPAYAGWKHDAYELHAVDAADPVPEGKYITATSVQNVGGVFRFVHTLDDIQTVPIDFQKQELLQRLKDKRWQHENAGTTFNGFPVHTDDRSKTLVLGALAAAQLDPSSSTKWVAADDTIHLLDAPEIAGLAFAILHHVNACFANFSVKSDAITNALSEVELQLININAGWPE